MSSAATPKKTVTQSASTGPKPAAAPVKVAAPALAPASTPAAKPASPSPVPAPAKVAAPKVPEVQAKVNPVNTTSNANGQKENKTVTIEAKIDVGFGNQLYLRGEGRGLSWSQGIPLTCVDGATWKWSGEASDKLKFKLLLNDSVWSKGEDLVAAPGERLEISPAF